MRQPRLFNVPEGQPLPRATGIDRTGRPKWTRIKPRNRIACDECVIVLHENHGAGPYPRAARWSRRVDGQKDGMRLCNEHADSWKAEEA